MSVETREAWLLLLVGELRPQFERIELAVPEVAISTGWPSKRAMSSSRPRIGECWNGRVAADGRPQIFISPVLADPVVVAATVLHELIHAVRPEAGHGAGFSQSAKRLGLQRPWTATTPTNECAAWLHSRVERIGPYPHAALVPGQGETKQSTRLLKATCLSCGYTARITAKWIDVGLPTCPCGDQLSV